MKCLLCNMDTITKQIEGVEIDMCINCGGVWLDGGELETLTGHDLMKYRQLMCPKCNLIMLTRNIGKVEVDHCYFCGGTWLDKGELEAINSIPEEIGGVNEEFTKFKSGVGRTRNIEIAKKSMNKDIELKDGMVDEVFVMYKDGLLITCSTKKVNEDEGVNEDVLAGTLMTIQDFIEVSFGKMGESGLKEIKFGDREILIERGDNIITAVVASGDVPDNFTDYVQEVIGKIEDRYKESLKDWDGNLSQLIGVQEMLTKAFKEQQEQDEGAEEAGGGPGEEAPPEEDQAPIQQDEGQGEPQPQQDRQPQDQQPEQEQPAQEEPQQPTQEQQDEQDQPQDEPRPENQQQPEPQAQEQSQAHEQQPQEQQPAQEQATQEQQPAQEQATQEQQPAQEQAPAQEQQQQPEQQEQPQEQKQEKKPSADDWPID